MVLMICSELFLPGVIFISPIILSMSTQSFRLEVDTLREKRWLTDEDYPLACREKEHALLMGPTVVFYFSNECLYMLLLIKFIKQYCLQSLFFFKFNKTSFFKHYTTQIEENIQGQPQILKIMTIVKLILIVIVITVSTCITLPINSLKDRCMVVFTNNQEDYLKMDIKFQKFHAQNKQEGYRITLINTEDQLQEVYSIEEGTFRKEVKLTPSVIYQLCIRVILNRLDEGEIQVNVQYNSGVHHTANLESTNIQIPANLVNIKDLKQSYSHLTYMSKMQGVVIEAMKKQKSTEDNIFKDQNSEINKLEWLSYVQIAVICIFGGYQFIRLGRIIDNKQNN